MNREELEALMHEAKQCLDNLHKINESRSTAWTMLDEQNWIDGIKKRYDPITARQLFEKYIESCKHRVKWDGMVKTQVVKYANAKYQLL